MKSNEERKAIQKRLQHIKHIQEQILDLSASDNYMGSYINWDLPDAKS